MRILRLDLSEGLETVDLHPFISVLHDMDQSQTETFQSAIQSLVNGSGSEIGGLVETNGELIELEEAGPLGPMTTEDVVVDVDGLLGSGTDSEAIELERAALLRQADIDAVLLEEVRADLDSSVAARVYRLRKLIALIEGQEARERRAALQRIQVKIDEVRSVPPTVTEVPEDIEDLISAWQTYSTERKAAADHITELEQRVQRAENALADAQKHLATAKSTAKPLLLTAAEDARLEELVNPTDKKRRSKGPTPDDEAEIDALLEKVRQPTYTAYAMYRLSPTPAEEHLEALTAAEECCAAATTEAEEARNALATDEVVVGLAAQFEVVKAHARDHLGPMLPTDLGAALAELVVEIENPDWLDALRTLYEQLVADDVALPEDIEPEELVEFANEWAEETRLEVTVDESLDPAELKAELAEAEVTFTRHAVAINRIDRIESQAVMSARRLAELDARPIGDIAGGVGALTDHLGALAMRLRGQNAASVPLLLMGDFQPLGVDALNGLLGQLEGLAQHHQLVIASNRVEVASWATSAGLQRALRTTPTQEGAARTD